MFGMQVDFGGGRARSSFPRLVEFSLQKKGGIPAALARCFGLLSDAECHASVHFEPLNAENVAPVVKLPNIFP